MRIFNWPNKGIFLWLCFLAVMACTKSPPPHDAPYVTHYLPPEVEAYFPMKLGDTLVYKDSASGMIDQVVCSKWQKMMIKTVANNYVFFEEEAVFQTGTANYPYLNYRHYSTRLGRKTGGQTLFYYRENYDHIMAFPVEVGDTIDYHYPSGYNIVAGFYPSITLNNQTFHDVYHVWLQKVSFRSSACDYYIARGKGIVAIRELKHNRLWVLQP